MPTVQAPVFSQRPSATTEPGLTRRRIWKSPEVLSHSVVVLTLPRIYLSPMTGEPKPETIAALENGADVESILGPLTLRIELPSIRRVRLDMITNTLQLSYGIAPRAGTVSIRFSSSQQADDAFGKLWRRLGEEFQLKPYRVATTELLRAPLIAIAAVLCTAGLLAFGLNVVEDLALERHWEVAQRLPGWRVVAMAGGAIAAGLTVWLQRRLTHPPERLDLTRN